MKNYTRIKTDIHWYIPTLDNGISNIETRRKDFQYLSAFLMEFYEKPYKCGWSNINNDTTRFEIASRPTNESLIDIYFINCNDSEERQSLEILVYFFPNKINWCSNNKINLAISMIIMTENIYSPLSVYKEVAQKMIYTLKNM